MNGSSVAAAGSEETQATANCKILDTNVIIDGRIADVCRTGFIEGTLYVPGFLSESRSYDGLIITRKDSGINSMKDLKGKRFAFVDPLSTSGTIYPQLAMMAAGIDPKKDLGQTIFAGGHDKVVLAVYQKQVDAGAIYGGVGSDARQRVQATIPDVMTQTKVIGHTDQIPNDNVSVRRELPAEMKSKLKAALQKIAGTDEGRRILDANDIDGLQPVKDSDYDSIRKATEALDINLEQAVQPKKK